TPSAGDTGNTGSNGNANGLIQSSSSTPKNLIPIVAAISSASVLVIFGFALYLGRRERKLKKTGESIGTASVDQYPSEHDNNFSRESETTQPHYRPATTIIDPTISELTPPWLPELDISTQRRLFENLAQELHPSVQRSLYEENVRVTAPTNNIVLESHLQRRYGMYSTWEHAMVMEWARLKRLGGVVDYQVDGALLSTLNIHSLKEKGNVEDFRLREKFMQALEFLKDSCSQLGNGGANVGSSGNDEDALPEYEADA
ncbi:hypothetical protein HDU76_008736, partial [Blyttiomyces sp. JEL0837]